MKEKKKCLFYYFSSLENYLDLISISYSSPFKWNDEFEKILPLKDEIVHQIGVRCLNIFIPKSSTLEDSFSDFSLSFQKNNNVGKNFEIAFTYEFEKVVIIDGDDIKKENYISFSRKEYYEFEKNLNDLVNKSDGYTPPKFEIVEDDEYVLPVKYYKREDLEEEKKVKEKYMKDLIGAYYFIESSNFSFEKTMKIKKFILKMMLLHKFSTFIYENECRIIKFFKEESKNGIWVESKKAEGILLFLSPFKFNKTIKKKYLKKLIKQAFKENINIYTINNKIYKSLKKWCVKKGLKKEVENYIKNKKFLTIYPDYPKK
jgi:hypothetical protein